MAASNLLIKYFSQTFLTRVSLDQQGSWYEPVQSGHHLLPCLPNVLGVGRAHMIQYITIFEEHVRLPDIKNHFYLMNTELWK